MTETALDTTRPRAIMPRWTKDQVALLRNTVAPNLTDDEFKVFGYVCKWTGLDPFVRQIYALKYFDGSSGGYKMVVQTGIDGFRLLASRTREYAGSDAPIFQENPDDPDHPLRATVTVYRFVNGEKCAFTGEARWKEFAKVKDGKLIGRWVDAGHNQLAKCAEAQALRKGFPAQLSSLTTDAEGPIIDIAPSDGGSTAQAPAADTKAGDMYVGKVTAYQPGDPAKKRPARLTFLLDAGGEITIGMFEKPPALKDLEQPPLGRRAQFKYEEKPNPRGGEPFRTLTHFAFEEHSPEAEKEPTDGTGRETATGPGQSDAARASSVGSPPGDTNVPSDTQDQGGGIPSMTFAEAKMHLTAPTKLSILEIAWSQVKPQLGNYQAMERSELNSLYEYRKGVLAKQK